MTKVALDTVKKNVVPAKLEPANQDTHLDEVKIHVSPSSFFDDALEAVSAVATTGSLIAAMGKRGEKQQLAIYDQMGSLIATQELTRTLNTKDIARFMSQNGKEYLEVSGKKSQTGNQFDFLCNDFLMSMGIFGESVGRVRDKLTSQLRVEQSSGTCSYIQRHTLQTADFELGASHIQPGLGVNGESFLLATKDALVTWTPQFGSEAHKPFVGWKYNSHKVSSEIPQNTALEFLAAQTDNKTQNAIIEFERGVLKVSDAQSRNLQFTDEAACVAPASHKESFITYVSADGRTVKGVQKHALAGASTAIFSKQLPQDGKILKIDAEPSGNFLAALIENGGKQKLSILRAGSLQELASIPDAGSTFVLGASGNLIFPDKDGKMRCAQTNMLQLASQSLPENREKLLAKASALNLELEDLELPDVPARKRKAQSSLKDNPDELLKRLEQKLLDIVNKELPNAKGVEAIETLMNKLEALSQRPNFVEFPKVCRPAFELLATHLMLARVEGFQTELNTFKADLAEYDTPEEVAALQTRFGALSISRRNLIVADATLRKALDAELSELKTEVNTRSQSAKESLAVNLEECVSKLDALVKQSHSKPELDLITADPEALKFSALVSLLPQPEERQQWLRRLGGLVQTRQLEIDEEYRELERHAQDEFTQKVNEAGDILEEIKNASLALSSAADMLVFQRSSPLLLKFQEKIKSLPEEARKEQESKLAILLADRGKVVDANLAVSKIKDGTEVNFGDASFPIFQDCKVSWHPEVRPFEAGGTIGKLVYVGNVGSDFEPEIDPVPCDLSSQETKAALSETRLNAAQHFKAFERRTTDFNPVWVVNDFTRGMLSKIAQLSSNQLRRQEKILIMEGEAGTGKNVLVDVFAHFTKREAFTFACNFQTEKEDITYAFKFDPEEGTYHVDSRLLEKLQTPGAIVVLDEINALPTGVAKMLNSLFDYRRCLFLPDGRVIKVHPSVILVGTMNPQSYLGVRPLSAEVKSRARILSVPYPPEKYPKGNAYAPYEAELLAAQIPELRGLKQADFYALWDFCINNNAASGGDKLATKALTDKVKEVRQVVRTANTVREAYHAFKSGKSNDIVTFVFSLRETVDIAAELRPNASVKEIIKDVVLPKIGEPEEKDRVEIIINNS